MDRFSPIFYSDVDLWLLESEEDMKLIQRQIDRDGSIQGYGLKETILDDINEEDL
jgi:hypothetical protein